MHSISVDMNELDPKIAYVQVTYVVTPCFEKSELEIRQSEFEQNHNISCFMFKTPFKESKAKDKPEDQWKCGTILINTIKCQISVIKVTCLFISYPTFLKEKEVRQFHPVYYSYSIIHFFIYEETDWNH